MDGFSTIATDRQCLFWNANASRRSDDGLLFFLSAILSF
jgi:hypothetical protein